MPMVLSFFVLFTITKVLIRFGVFHKDTFEMTFLFIDNGSCGELMITTTSWFLYFVVVIIIIDEGGVEVGKV